MHTGAEYRRETCPKKKGGGGGGAHSPDLKAVVYQIARDCLVFCIIRIVAADINIGLPSRDQTTERRLRQVLFMPSHNVYGDILNNAGFSSLELQYF